VIGVVADWRVMLDPDIVFLLLLPPLLFLEGWRISPDDMFEDGATILELGLEFVEARGDAMAVTRVRRTTIGDLIQLTANGIIVVMPGEQLPTIQAGAADSIRVTGHHEPG